MIFDIPTVRSMKASAMSLIFSCSSLEGSSPVPEVCNDQFHEYGGRKLNSPRGIQQSLHICFSPFLFRSCRRFRVWRKLLVDDAWEHEEEYLLALDQKCRWFEESEFWDHLDTIQISKIMLNFEDHGERDIDICLTYTNGQAILLSTKFLKSWNCFWLPPRELGSSRRTFM